MIEKEIKKIVLPDTVEHFIKVPKEIILSTDISEHRISVFLYLNYNQTWDNMVHYSPLYMIEWSGYKPNWDRHNKNNIYEKFKKCMQWYYANGYLYSFKENAFSQNTFQSSELCKDKINTYSNFGIIYDFEIEAINNYHSSYRPLNRSILLLLLSYIRAYSWIRVNEVSGHSKSSKKEKPEIFHSTFQTMEFYTGISRKLISKATDALEGMGLIKTFRMPNYQDTNGGWHTDDIIYVCPYKYIYVNGIIRKCSKEEYDSQTELENGIIFVKNQNYTNKKFYQN